MADEQQGSAAAPAAPAPVSVFEEARQALTATPDAPASTAPDAATPDAPTADSAAPAPAEPSDKPDDPKGTRRQKGEEAYQRGLDEGRKQAEAERAAQAEAEAAERTQREQRESLLTLIKAAKDGDYDATVKLAELEEGRLTATDAQARELQLFRAAEEKVFTSIARDFASLKGHAGIDEDGFKTLLEAPSVAEYGKRAFALGQQSQASEITTLQTRVRELEGKLAGRTPSPLGANGTTAAGSFAELKGMHRAFAEAKAELGYGT
jgi:hypothetical protein